MKLAIIGCGNPNRSDDGAGPWVIAQMHQEGVPSHVDLYDAGTDGMGLLYQARGMSHLIIIDACVPSGSPGALFEVPGHILAAPPPQSLNLHDFRWDHALYAGKRIYGADFPKFVKVFLIEAETLALGLNLSAKVRATCANLIARLNHLAQDPAEFLSGIA